MNQIAFETELTRERRARLAAERLLDQKQTELREANRKLSKHALSLSGQIVDQRKVVEQLEGENTQVTEDLEIANHKVVAVEQLLWDALETIPDGFALFDADLCLIAANKPYLRAFDQEANLGPGVNFESVLDLCLDEGVVDLQGQEETDWYNFMLQRWNGSRIEPATLRFWNGMYVKMIDRRTADGGVVSLVLNITDTIKKEDELREARDKAQAADRAKSTFLAKMSHELRTPMNGVVGMADLLLDGELDEENTLYASTIKSSSEALLEIINNVLDFSKIDAERIELRPTAFDLERMVHEVALILEPSVMQKQISLSVDYDQFLPTGFVGDHGRIRQILVNLVGNAVKFTEDGHVIIRIVGVPNPGSQTCRLHIAVEDTGIGIAQNKVDHIFGEFNQAEDDSNRSYEGTGLGLAITRRLIEQMGGEVWVDSEKGEGSCFGFMVELPVTEGQEMLPRTDLDFPKRVLVMDANRLHQATFARQLSVMGLVVDTCETSEDALRMMRDTKPDVVFAALELEEAGPLGFEEICENTCPGLPVVLLTAEAAGPDATGHILQKPVLRKDLLELLPKLQPTPPETSDAAPSHRVFRVLAAEDNKTNQLVFTKMLKNTNIEMTMVGNGVEAVAAFEKQRPDLIFMDISMPQLDGMEASKAIRALEAETDMAPVPIVAMTAHALDGDKERILDSGIDHYLTKPLKKEALLQHIFNYAPEDYELQLTTSEAASDAGPKVTPAAAAG